MTYTVKLIGWTGASKTDIEAVERRFCDHLQAELGAKVEDAYRAWFKACTLTDDTRRETWPAAAREAVDRWDRIYAKATREALERLPGKGAEAWFDVTLPDMP